MTVESEGVSLTDGKMRRLNKRANANKSDGYRNTNGQIIALKRRGLSEIGNTV